MCEIKVCKRVHGTIARVNGARHTKCVCHIGCSSKAASGKVVKFFKVCAPWSSRSVKRSRLEKSSGYNRKRASGARHMKCVHHIGCSSKAVSGNVVIYHGGGVLHSNHLHTMSFAHF